jgi:predicted nucleic acid-binding protein
MKRFLLDTNHLSEAVRRVSVVRDKVQQQRRQGFVFGTCGPALCELLVGIVQRKDAAATQRRLEGLLQVVRLWPVDLEVASR